MSDEEAENDIALTDKEFKKIKKPEFFKVPAIERYMFGDLFLHFESKLAEEERRKANPFIEIGRNVKIKSGTIIGGDGFSYKREKDGKLEHGTHKCKVIIEDNVDIGSCSCIDRGSYRNTVIGEGTKIDNLAHIAHNVIIGKHCIIGAGVILGGSVEIGDYCNIWCNAFIHQHVKVEHHCTIGANSYLRHSTRPHQTWYGSPAVLKR
ncbi:MAG: DapH/DapD/GlmU-related protein [Thermodesulfobacteriota bacterium]